MRVWWLFKKERELKNNIKQRGYNGPNKLPHEAYIRQNGTDEVLEKVEKGPKRIMKINVNLSAHETKAIEVFEGDTPEGLAARFALENGE